MTRIVIVLFLLTSVMACNEVASGPVSGVLSNEATAEPSCPEGSESVVVTKSVPFTFEDQLPIFKEPPLNSRYFIQGFGDGGRAARPEVFEPLPEGDSPRVGGLNSRVAQVGDEICLAPEEQDNCVGPTFLDRCANDYYVKKSLKTHPKRDLYCTFLIPEGEPLVDESKVKDAFGYTATVWANLNGDNPKSIFWEAEIPDNFLETARLVETRDGINYVEVSFPIPLSLLRMTLVDSDHGPVFQPDVVELWIMAWQLDYFLNDEGEWFAFGGGGYLLMSSTRCAEMPQEWTW